MERLSNNQIFQYNGSPITFQKGDSVMVNATQMAKPFGKEPKFWLMNQSTTDYLNELSKVRNLTLTDLVQVTKGGNNPGTWMHEDVAMEFARWLSPAFAIWCNDRIKELLQYGMTATQPTLEQMIDNPDLVIQLATQLKREREKKVLMPNNTPYQKYVELGWFRCVESKFSKPNGDTCINIKTVVLQKGLDGIRKMFNNKK